MTIESIYYFLIGSVNFLGIELQDRHIDCTCFFSKKSTPSRLDCSRTTEITGHLRFSFHLLSSDERYLIEFGQIRLKTHSGKC